MQPRVNVRLADASVLVAMGALEEQPVPPPPPAPPPAAEPEQPAPQPSQVEQAAVKVALSAAIVDAGLTPDAEDQAAMAAVAKLDSATAAAVVRWVKRKKKDTVPVPPIKLGG